MNISCASCTATYDIPNNRLPAKELKTKCKNCNNEMLIPAAEKIEKMDAVNVIDFNKEQAIDAINDFKDMPIEQYNKLTKEKKTALMITASITAFIVLVSVFDNDVFDFLLKLSILAFFWLMIVGCIKGIKENSVVFYNNRDVYMSFMIVGSMVGAFICIAILDNFLFDGDILKSDVGGVIIGFTVLSAALYFMYKTISSSLFHNRGESKINMAYAISAKVGSGIIYPAVLLFSLLGVTGSNSNMNNSKSSLEYNKHKDSRDSSIIFMTLFAIAGGWLIKKLVNGEAVYRKRGWDLINISEVDS